MKRKQFIRSTLLASAGVITSSMLGSKNLFSYNPKTPNYHPDHLLKAFGVQLWSIRDDFQANPKSVMEQLAQFGYKYIENCELEKGLLWGMSLQEYKSLLQDNHLKMYASHLNVKEHFEKKVSMLAELGAKYAVCPYLGAQKTLDDYKTFAQECNKKGEICKKYGLKYAYHNHDYSFKPIDGVLPQTIFMEYTDPELVDFEIDIYWVTVAGQNPVEWLEKYKNRFRLCHIKDLKKQPGADNSKNSCDLGQGSIDIANIIKIAKNNGMKYYFVEQEAFDNSTPMNSIKNDATYMNQFVS